LHSFATLRKRAIQPIIGEMIVFFTHGAENKARYYGTQSNGKRGGKRKANGAVLAG
jgi:hypothetical protein